MELNEPHTSHEHASLNLKVLLLVFAVILIAALGLLVWQQNHSAADSQDEAQLHPKKTATVSVDTSTWKTYSNSTYNFSYLYPPTWKVTEDVAPAPRDQQPWQSFIFSASISASGANAESGHVAVSQSSAADLMAAIAEPQGKLTWQDVTVNSVAAKKTIEADGTIEYIVAHGSFTYNLEVVTGEADTNNIKAVIASFKFTK